MADAPTRYTLKTIADLLDVPPDRLPACLAELGRALLLVRAVLSASDGKLTLRETGCEWIDDGDTCLDVALTVGEETTTFRVDDGLAGGLARPPSAGHPAST